MKIAMHLKVFAQLATIAVSASLCACGDNGPEAEKITTPSVITIGASTTRTTAVVTGEVISDGGAPLTDYGICWSTSNIPTIEDNKIMDSDDHDTYISLDLENLEPETTYFFRGYAINSVGIGYGEIKIFHTQVSTWYALEGFYEIVGGSITRNGPSGPDLSLGGDYQDNILIGFFTINANTMQIHPVWKDGSGIAGLGDVYVTVNTTTNKLTLTVSPAQADFTVNPSLDNILIPGYPIVVDSPTPQEFIFNFGWGADPNTRVITDLRVRYDSPL